MIKSMPDTQTAYPAYKLLKSLAEFAAEEANEVLIVFGRGVYVDENTSQAASVELVRHWRTNYARSRLLKLAEKAEGLFRQVQCRIRNFAYPAYYFYLPTGGTSMVRSLRGKLQQGWMYPYR